MSSCCACSSPESAATGAESSAAGWMRLAVAGLIAGQSMIFGLAVSISPPTGTARWILHGVLAASAVAVFLLAGLPVLREAWAAARRGRIVIEQLFLAGIAGAFGASVHCTITGFGHIYYEVVAILVAVYTFGKLIGEKRRTAALEAARALGWEFETCERISCDGSTRTVPSAELEPGDRVVVRAGGAIPCDGEVEEGTAFVRETALTGEPFPVVKRPGDSVMAGSHSVDGLLTLRATTSGRERKLDSLLARVRAAQEKPSDLQQEADRLVAWFLPAVLVIAGATFAFWTWRDGWIVGLFNSLAVILVACPCSMGLATPVGIWSALAALAGRGIVPRDANLVERLGRADTVVFDKTGTLGEEELERVDFVTVSGADRSALLADVAALEASSNHPVARAFRQAGVGSVPTTLIAGSGIEGQVRERTLRVGNLAVVPESERPAAEALAAELRGSTGGSHRVFVVADERIVGAALLRERLRPSAHAVIDELGGLGLHCEVLTGDRAEAAAVHGLPNVRAGLSPDEKAECVARLHASGRRVLFVGDGVNDAPAMSEADVSLAMGSGSALARESATAELNSADLTAVTFAITRCRGTIAAIRGNLRFAAAYNLIGMTLAATGILHPVAAALLMLVSSFSVTWRALSPGRERRRPIRIPWRAAVPATALALQGPVLVYLGGYHGMIAAGFVLLFLAAGAVLAAWMAQRPFGRFAEMAVGMFTVGGLAMLGGWWADAGFAAIVRDGACLCGCAKSNMGLGLFAKINWMDVSMIAASVPAVFLEENRSGRWRCWMAGAVGMLAGMELAAWLMAQLPMAAPQAAFFATYGAMMFGMCIGMIVACGAWRRWKGGN
ncbi:MAG: cation-translocating P-type ATPase [Terrimicrobiaceae bacterium]|nr:cation-translocating P-type ATPase [Terrimicrobiaceae bacterium]